MDSVDCARAFLVVAETGGFSAAARQLNIVPSVITKRISQFEADIGRQLFVRTTRHVELTSVGKGVLQYAQDLVLAYDRMLGDIPNDITELSGRLRVKAPSTLTYLYLGSILNRFLDEHSNVSLELLLIDRPVNPVTEGFNLVITGLPPSYDQVDEVPLFPIRRMLFASAAYLEKMGTPVTAEELAHHRCLQYSYLSPEMTWSLTSIRGQLDVTVNAVFHTNDIKVMHQAILDGLGIGILPDYVAQDCVADGQLVQVLQDFWLPTYWFRAQVPRANRQRQLMQALIAHIQKGFASINQTWTANERPAQ